MGRTDLKFCLHVSDCPVSVYISDCIVTATIIIVVGYVYTVVTVAIGSDGCPSTAPLVIRHVVVVFCW